MAAGTEGTYHPDGCGCPTGKPGCVPFATVHGTPAIQTIQVGPVVSSDAPAPKPVKLNRHERRKLQAFLRKGKKK